MALTPSLTSGSPWSGAVGERDVKICLAYFQHNWAVQRGILICWELPQESEPIGVGRGALPGRGGIATETR